MLPRMVLLSSAYCSLDASPAPPCRHNLADAVAAMQRYETMADASVLFCTYPLRCLPNPCRHHLADAVAAMQRYEVVASTQLEIASEELRAAAKALGRVTGAIDTEQVLDSIFTEFCIGK